MKNLESIQELFGRTMDQLTSGAWPQFLKTAAWTFKYSFPDQLLIYAQRPDATACASIELWNKRLGRTVNVDAAHIALLDDHGDEIKLRYVVDVSDTTGPREIPLWRLTERNREYVYTGLAAAFDVGIPVEGANPTRFFESIAHRIVQAAMPQASLSLQRIKDSCDTLRGLTPQFAENMLSELLTASVTAVMMYRCGLEPDFSYMPADPMRNVFVFADPRAFSILGQTTQAVSFEALSVAAKAAKDYDKTHKEELNYDHTVSQSRGVQDPGLNDSRERTSEQIRENAQDIPQGESTERVHSADADRPADTSSAGVGPQRGNDVSADSGAVRAEESGPQQGPEPDSLDGAYDVSSDAGRGGSPDGADSRLTEENLPDASEYGIDVSFPSVAQQVAELGKVGQCYC